VARRFVSSARRQGPRRHTLWGASADATAVTALGGATSVLAQSFSEATLTAFGASPSTVIRIRGSLYVQSDQSVAGERPFGALGCAVVSEQARAAGIASLPSPITDEDSDLFFLWIPWQAAATVSSTGGTFYDLMYDFPFDSKAMRKIQAGDALVTTIENAALAGIGAQFILKFRTLFKLV